MRVAYILKRYPRYSETFIVNEILAHEAAGLDVTIFALRPPSDTHFQDAIARVRAPVIYIPNESVKASVLWQELRDARATLSDPLEIDGLLEENALTVRQALNIAHHVRSLGIDHLHAHFATVAASVARLAGRFARIPFTITAHAKDIFHESVEREDLERKLTDASAVVTVSDFNRSHLRSFHPPTQQKILRIYNGIDLERLEYRPPRNRPSLILAVGRLVEKKGFGDLIDACAELAARGVRFRCQIIGQGELENELHARIEASGLSELVELCGPRPLAEVIERLSLAAVLAAPCRVGEDGNRDGLPTVLLEAMAVGTPCVSTDVTGIPEAIRNEDTGLIVPQDSPKELADAIERLLADAPLGRRLAGQARRLLDRDFDVAKNSASLRAVFEAFQRVDREPWVRAGS